MFESEEICTPFLVTVGPSQDRVKRSRRANKRTHEEVKKFLFISNLHSEREEQGEGITSFFVTRSRYLAFFRNLENPAIVLGIKHINERPS